MNETGSANAWHGLIKMCPDCGDVMVLLETQLWRGWCCTRGIFSDSEGCTCETIEEKPHTVTEAERERRRKRCLRRVKKWLGHDWRTDKEIKRVIDNYLVRRWVTGAAYDPWSDDEVKRMLTQELEKRPNTPVSKTMRPIRRAVVQQTARVIMEATEGDPREWHVYVLYMSGCTYQEIRKKTGIKSPATVAKLLKRFRAKHPQLPLTNRRSFGRSRRFVTYNDNLLIRGYAGHSPNYPAEGEDENDA